MRAGLIAQVEATVPKARGLMEQFCDDVEGGRVVLRTYLTTAGKYRHYLAAGAAAEDLKFNATTITLPHFVYVTELIREDATLDDQGARAVVGHIVFNATSSTDLNADLLFAHLPHLAFVRDLDCDPAERDYDERIILISEERPYAQRLRS